MAASVASAASGSGRAAAPGDRPNILWLVSEDNNPYIGAYGDKLAHTPTLDGLARRGILYRNVYSAAPVCAPSRFGLITGAYAESCAPANHMRAQARLPDGWRTTPQFMREAGYYCTNNSKTDYNCDVDPSRVWNESSNDAHWRNRSAGQPFFSVFNHMTTHESEVFRTFEGRVKPEDIKVPAYLPDTLEIRRDFATYYNLIEKMDGELGAKLAELDQAGLTDDTIVFYYSDNGGVLPRSKRYCYDEGVRCALIAYLPPKWAHLAPGRPGSVVESPVSLIDLPPTVLALAGQPKPPQMHGTPLFGTVAPTPQRYAFSMRNRMDERYDMVRTVTDGRWRYIRNYMPHLPAGQQQAYAWLAKGYQSFEAEHLAGRLMPEQERFFQPRPFEELYDLRTDPAEINNLAAAPAGQAKLRELRRALDSQMLKINDNGFIPEDSSLEAQIAGRGANSAYPLPRLMALAALACGRNAANLMALRRDLGHDNEAVRYWAAMGLLMLGRGAAPALGAVRARLRSETSPQVKVVLAEALGQAGHPAEAVALLARVLDNDRSRRVKLQAINALQRLGAAARPALPAAERAAATGDEYLKNSARYLKLKLNGHYTPSTPIFDTSTLANLSSRQVRLRL
ncbi:sulfatase-like hydrolase/transferase [Phenylobacterium sp. J367]|uniref:sulfatase-like hydrolase/transferase n=1 Tax=Phenylobacterium sp. J367 TaxID=2898435 RepID=UPI002150FDC7|nr:sulfatase-like hydrolase/transferase [Phenylobacterium sp. J367]MCR5880010.1 sulfatase-like hydrolase/transferase [Phenylobacterium sp. J367]